MRRLAVALCGLLLMGCQQQPNPAICRELPDAKYVDDISSKLVTLQDNADPKKQAAFEDGTKWVASSCVRKNAYKFALDEKSTNQAVSSAVVAACSTQIDRFASYWAFKQVDALSKADPEQSATYLADLDSYKQPHREALENLALASVVEARAGHCRPVQ